MPESQQTSDYPGSLDTWVTLTDKEDLSEASDLNKIKAAVEAIETELGTDPAGTATDLKTRLAIALAGNGALANGTSFPVSPTPIDGQVFYRTDEDTFYIYDGSSWESISVPTVHLYSFAFGGNGDTTKGISTNLSASASNQADLHWFANSTSYQTVITTKFRKVAGISTINFFARIGCTPNGGGDASCNVDVGAGTATGASTTTTDVPFVWVSGTVDVSGLTNDTTYDLLIQLRKETSGVCQMDSFLAFGS